MKRIHIVGIAFAAIFAFSMVSASGASAFSLWDKCAKVASGSFLDSDCSMGGAGEWEWLEITVPTEVDSEITTLTLKSNGVTIDCEGSSDGTVGGGANDEVALILNIHGEEVTEAKPVTCPVLAGELACGKEATAWPVNLPWNTELVANGDLLGPHSGGGNPGWKVLCIGGLKAENTCTREDTILEVTNLLTSLQVDLLFNPAEKANCTTGGVGSGEVEGTISILLVSGEGLQAM